MDIYIDILFIENFLINFTLLFLCYRLLNLKSNKLMLFMAGAAGALYSILIVILKTEFLSGLIFKFLFSVIMLLIAYGKMPFQKFLKVISVFYVITFGFAGCVFALSYSSVLGAYVSNGDIYYFSNASAGMLVSGLILMALLLSAAINYFKTKNYLKGICGKLDIIFGESRIETTAFIDTGNSLVEPISGYPVIIIERDLLKEIEPDQWQKRIRMIPFSTIGKKDGLMEGFKPDRIVFKDIVSTEVIIGIFEGKLSHTNEYRALVNPEIIKEAENESKNI